MPLGDDLVANEDSVEFSIVESNSTDVTCVEVSSVLETECDLYG
jgi:hypothetical protein